MKIKKLMKFFSINLSQIYTKELFYISILITSKYIIENVILNYFLLI